MERVGSLARITQHVIPVLPRRDTDVCALQDLRANSARKVRMEVASTTSSDPLHREFHLKQNLVLSILPLKLN